MKIVIIGAGAVGSDLARTISEREHDVIVVEKDVDVLGTAQESLDCHFVHGNGVNPATLESIGMAGCDLFAAVTNRDEINLIACLTAHRLGARVKVARVRNDDYFLGSRLALDGIDLAINPDHEAAHSIREILFQTAAREVYEFAGGRVRVVASRVASDSYVAGRRLRDLDREQGENIALVAAVSRGDETVIPNGDTVLQPDDTIYFTGERRLVDRSLYFVQTRGRALNRVMIVGATAMGIELARDLLAAGVKVKLIDDDEARCEHASRQLHRALVLRGDAVDASLLESEGVGEMDGFVAVGGEEEINILACLLARHHGARKTVCLVDRPDYVPLLPDLGIDAAVSPRLSTAAWIARFVKRGAVISAEKLGYTGAEILQLRLGDAHPAAGRPLHKLAFPRHAVIGAVLTRGRVETPRGDTVLRAGDEVIVFALPDAVHAVEDFFAGGARRT